MHKLELNSPAGDMESVKAAIYNGADAIYLSMKHFNARRLAVNFSINDLKEIIILAHLNKVKIYLALNTLVRDDEINLWFDLLNQAYLAGIDAVIIQELFFAPFIKKFFPNLKIHASTQASLMNYHGINFFSDIDSVVLSRELTSDEIKLIRKNTKIKLEMFVHGHLCISYSGQCLISSLIGKRSGNRGICASSCRKLYNNKYLISPKDLMLANEIKMIYDLGIDAIKIEGRMKSSRYVSSTTNAYRKQIDNISSGKDLSEKELDELKIHFNREFTTGFFAGNKSIIGSDMPMNRGILLGTIKDDRLMLLHELQIGDGIGFWDPFIQGKMEGFVLNKLFLDGSTARNAKKGDYVTIPSRHFKENTKVFLTSKIDKNPRLTQNKLIIFEIKVFGKVNEPLNIQWKEHKVHTNELLKEARNNVFTQEDIEKYLKKSERLGVSWKITTFDVQNNLFIPFSEINKIRSALEEELFEFAVIKRESNLAKIDLNESEKKLIEPKFIVKVYSLQQLVEANNASPYAIYYDIFNDDLEDAKKSCTNSRFFLDTPVIMTDTDILKAENIIKKIQPDGMCIGNWGLLDIPFKGEKHGKYSLNIFNDISINSVLKKGIIPMISPELSSNQIIKLKNKEIIYYAHGPIPVMHFKGVMNEKLLKDERNFTFPLRIVNNNTEMLYSRQIATFEKINELIKTGIRYFFLDLTKDTLRIIEAYNNIINGVHQDISMLKKGTTIGNFVKGVA